MSFRALVAAAIVAATASGWAIAYLRGERIDKLEALLKASRSDLEACAGDRIELERAIEEQNRLIVELGERYRDSVYRLERLRIEANRRAEEYRADAEDASRRAEELREAVSRLTEAEACVESMRWLSEELRRLR